MDIPCIISSGPGEVFPTRSDNVHARRMARSAPRRLSRSLANARLTNSIALIDVLALSHEPVACALQVHLYSWNRSCAV